MRALLSDDRLPALGPGVPNLAARPSLEALTIDRLFAPAIVRGQAEARACLAGLWLLHDFLNESHEISQSISTREGSYWHALMHRREPDYSNAAYWFRRVGGHPVFEPLRAESAVLAADEPHGAVRFLKTQAKWDPSAFIDLCAECVAGYAPVDMLCRRIQRRESDLLFEYCYQGAIGGKR